MVEEIWKVVKDAPDYEVSNLGQVRRIKTQRVLKPAGNGRRARVVLMSYGERWTVVIEDLVRLVFKRVVEQHTGERWKPVSCAWGYEISDQSRVRNKKTGRVLKPYLNNRTGRPQVTLIDDGYRITRPVHRLMEEAFG